LKKSFWVVLMVLVLICAGALVLKAEGPKKVSEKFEINSDVAHFAKGAKSKIPPKYKLVPLSHQKHADLYGCKICHHELESDSPDQQKLAKKCSNAGCHSAEAKDKCLDLKEAMHKQCYKDCHKTDDKAKAAKAPTKCGDCHAKAGTETETDEKAEE